MKMDGKTFTAASELSANQHRRLSLVSNVLAKWLSLATPESQSTDAASSESATPPEEQAVEEFLSITAEPKSTETYPGYTPPFAAESMQEIKPVSTQLPDMVGGMLNPTPTTRARDQEHCFSNQRYPAGTAGWHVAGIQRHHGERRERSWGDGHPGWQAVPGSDGCAG